MIRMIVDKIAVQNDKARARVFLEECARVAKDEACGAEPVAVCVRLII